LLVALTLQSVCSLPDTTLQPAGVSVRVAKALGTRGYDKLRVSLVHYTDEARASSGQPAPSEAVQWSYSNQFQHRWTNYSLSTAIVTVQPGVGESLILDNYNIEVKIPEVTHGSVGVLIGDPCIHNDPTWCKYANYFQVKTTLQGVLNNLAKHDELDWWAMVGDLFYDQTGSITTEFFSGLSMAVGGKVHMVTMGNHDYWVNGSPGVVQLADSLANGHMQWYAQDAVSAQGSSPVPFNFTTNPDEGQLADISNTFWYNAYGNVAFIGFSNAFDWNANQPYFEEACAWVQQAQPELVVMMGHWNSVDHGCATTMDTDDVYTRVRQISGCSELGTRLKYVEGHKHCNFVQRNNTGFLFGSFGFEDGDASCHGAFGIPVLDTRGGEAVIYYFELAKMEVKVENFDEILQCFADNGLSGCTQHAQVWMREPLPGSPLIVV